MRVKSKLNLEESKVVISMLQSLVGLTTTIALRSREAHWNVKGPSFGPLHELFGDFYDFANDWVDTLAERIVQQGGVAAALNGGWEPGPQVGDEKTLLHNIAQLANHLAEQLHSATLMVDEDESTRDALIEFNRDLEKWIWKIEAHLQEFVKVSKKAAKVEPEVVTFKYTWVHQPTGDTGVKEWSGLSHQDFLDDLAAWNRRGYGKWLYSEIENEEENSLFSPTHMSSRSPSFQTFRP